MKVRTMVVEDDVMVAEINKRYVEMVEGFEVVKVAASADEALEALDKLKIDLILLDIFMPGTDGIELLTQIRNRGQGVDVIAVTAASDNQTIMKVLRFGAVDYIIKPFTFERLEEALSAYSEFSRLSHLKEVKQEDLDSYILNRDGGVVQDLPKGIDRNTLKKVCQKIQQMGNTAFSTEELAGMVGVSRVSTRKYLEFLSSEKILKMELLYGTVGRPVYKYRCTGRGRDALGRF